MQITVSGKQVDLSDALRTRVAEQLEAIAGKYFDHALEAHVTFGRARSFFTCDINVHAGRGLTLRGEGEAADAHALSTMRRNTSPSACAATAGASTSTPATSPTASDPKAARQYVLRQEEERPDGDGGSRRRRPTRP